MTTQDSTTMICRKCAVEKNSDDFLYQRRVCKTCTQKQNKEYKKEWSPKNRERRKQYDHEYRMRPENRKRKRELSRKHIKSPEGKIREIIKFHNYQSRKLSLPNTLTPDQWQNALNYFNGCCAVCGRQLNDMFGEFTSAMDHWIPLSYKGDDNPGTVAQNIIPLCHGIDGCNNRKKNIMPDIWLERQFGKRKAKKIMVRIQSYLECLNK